MTEYESRRAAGPEERRTSARPADVLRAMTRSLLAALLLAGLVAAAAGAARQGGRPVALVTAEQQNQLLAVELPEGRSYGGSRCPPIPRT